MNVFVVSLIKDFDRRELLNKSFLKYYNDFFIFNALNREDAKIYIDNGNKLKKNKIEMTLSEIACALSHLGIMKDIVLNNIKFAIILEDDVIGGDEDIDEILKIYLSLPENSILIAGGQEGLRSYKNLYGLSVKDKVYRIPQLYYRYLSRTCCYVVSNQIARKIIQLQSDSLERADQWDKLLKECENVYFSPILKHPLILENSHIEKERKIKKGNNILQVIIREGITYSLYYYLRKIITSYWARYKGYIRIKDNEK
ncbi:glycosyltransferase family 25 protein [Acinetobacter sp. VNH17]|uniref:Glycosyltransferase family 25 protein n=1 Tax=Acinetobacter thutiue TaxID=2998078 RepID=A0ABT7WPA0_9GAMM|nr:glycosyltransferase family 25 protein [Acinetobacter thutiue]MCY6412407.1 glycosyltransferase family 25 protein [Acinetobacter thutiue]MDN0014511.1 glycosyltransferase family 25 protein [Acinetobacter thutiue]